MTLSFCYGTYLDCFFLKIQIWTSVCNWNVFVCLFFVVVVVVAVYLELAKAIKDSYNFPQTVK